MEFECTLLRTALAEGLSEEIAGVPPGPFIGLRREISDQELVPRVARRRPEIQWLRHVVFGSVVQLRLPLQHRLFTVDLRIPRFETLAGRDRRDAVADK